jgi:hypothetical protein
MDTTNSVRQARFRERQRDDRVVYRVEVERDAVLDFLVSTRRLSRDEILNRDLVERALSELIAEWIRDDD